MSAYSPTLDERRGFWRLSRTTWLVCRHVGLLAGRPAPGNGDPGREAVHRQAASDPRRDVRRVFSVRRTAWRNILPTSRALPARSKFSGVRLFQSSRDHPPAAATTLHALPPLPPSPPAVALLQATPPGIPDPRAETALEGPLARPDAAEGEGGP